MGGLCTIQVNEAKAIDGGFRNGFQAILELCKCYNHRVLHTLYAQRSALSWSYRNIAPSRTCAPLPQSS